MRKHHFSLNDGGYEELQRKMRIYQEQQGSHLHVPTPGSQAHVLPSKIVTEAHNDVVVLGATNEVEARCLAANIPIQLTLLLLKLLEKSVITPADLREVLDPSVGAEEI